MKKNMRKRHRPRSKKTPQLKSLISMQRTTNDGLIATLSSQAELLQAVEYVQQQQATDRRLSLSQYESWHSIHEANYRVSRNIHMFLAATVVMLLLIILFTR